MTAHVTFTTPTIEFTTSIEKEEFCEYLFHKGIDFVDSVRCKYGVKIRMGIYDTTEIENLIADSEKWNKEFHKDILLKEYQGITNILALGESVDSALNYLQHHFDFSMDTLDMGYVQVCTHFFQYTIYVNDNYLYLSREVERFIHQEPMGTVQVSLDENQQFVIYEVG